MKTISSLLLGTLPCLFFGGPAFGQAPGADELLKAARLVATLQHQDLTGQIRKVTGKGSFKIPVGLHLRGENIQFSYHQPRNNKPIRFHMRHGKERFDLFEIVNGKTQRFPDARLGQAIEGTDLSYEDLAMRFLYRPKGVVQGAEKIKGQNCWVLRVVNPGKGGQYGQVRVWIHQKFRALMQIEGFDRQGHPLKRFQITDLMKVGDTHTLKRMRVDRWGVGGKHLGLTYLEFDKP